MSDDSLLLIMYGCWALAFTLFIHLRRKDRP